MIHRLSCTSACGIFPDQGLNPCLLHWQVDSLPLSHQGSPRNVKGSPWVSAQKHFWIFSSSSHLRQQAGGCPPCQSGRHRKIKEKENIVLKEWPPLCIYFLLYFSLKHSVFFFLFCFECHFLKIFKNQLYSGLKKFYLFIWLLWVLAVACRIFSVTACGI